MAKTAIKTEETSSEIAAIHNQQQPGNAVPVAGDLKRQGKQVAEMVLFDDQLFQRVQKLGQLMAGSKTMVPKHLQGNASDCAAVILQAMRWGIDPYACAQKTHVVSGTIGYEAQLVNAVLLANAPIEGRPKYTKIGDWSKVIGRFKEVESKYKDENGKLKKYQKPDWTLNDEKGLGVRLEIKLKGEEVHPFELMLSQATVRNSTLWASDPFQQLCYLAIKRWARLHCPDVIMGVYTPDELEDAQNHRGFENAIDITPKEEADDVPAQSKAEQFAASEASVTDAVIEENAQAAKSELPEDKPAKPATLIERYNIALEALKSAKEISTLEYLTKSQNYKQLLSDLDANSMDKEKTTLITESGNRYSELAQTSAA